MDVCIARVAHIRVARALHGRVYSIVYTRVAHMRVARALHGRVCLHTNVYMLRSSTYIPYISREPVHILTPFLKRSNIVYTHARIRAHKSKIIMYISRAPPVHIPALF